VRKQCSLKGSEPEMNENEDSKVLEKEGTVTGVLMTPSLILILILI
jgi:hypothetical protein